MTSTTATTFRVSDKQPETHWSFGQPTPAHAVNLSEIEATQEQIKRILPYRDNKCTEILQMSNFPPKAYYPKNGFVSTVVDAYNCHHNLIIRPDDIWAAVMTQFSFYVNKHAEDFRGKFVNFEGKKLLTITIDGTLRTAPYDLFVKLMTKEIDRNLVDPEVKSWIIPNFSTTTDDDLVTIGVVFMASMKKYFDYKCDIRCGIPNITLEGTLEDWQNVHERLGKLKEYKLEKWYDMLEPILQQFVDAKRGKVDVDFWQKVVNHEAGGSGPSYISGWITAFCVFDKDGNWQDSNLSHISFGGFTKEWLRLDTDDIPRGNVQVDVIIDDGALHNSVMFAGHLAAEMKGENGETLQPTLGWVMSLKPVDEAFKKLLGKYNLPGPKIEEQQN